MRPGRGRSWGWLTASTTGGLAQTGAFSAGAGRSGWAEFVVAEGVVVLEGDHVNGGKSLIHVAVPVGIPSS